MTTADRQPPGSVRVGDTERDAVLTLLAQAHASGHLDLEELDERVRAAATAKTRAQLASLTEDLPRGGGSAAAGGIPHGARAAGRTARDVLAAVWTHVWARIALFGVAAGLGVGGAITLLGGDEDGANQDIGQSLEVENEHGDGPPVWIVVGVLVAVTVAVLLLIRRRRRAQGR